MKIEISLRSALAFLRRISFEPRSVSGAPAWAFAGDQDSVRDRIEKILDRIVGLEDVKKEIDSYLSYAALQNRKEQLGISAAPLTLHYAFRGNPGTGKTVVARYLAQILYLVGITRKEEIVEVDRSDLVGQYLGETAQKTDEIIRRAQGGVLFIDEAYALAPESKDDLYAREAIGILLKRMEDMRKNLVVIVAGYPEDMDRLFVTYPGLKSRFTRFIDFPNRTVAELVRIGVIALRDYGLRFEPEAERSLALAIEQAREIDAEFANGRSVRNLLDAILLKQSDRLRSLPAAALTEEEILTLREADVRHFIRIEEDT